ncbi:hypothetical protein M422DRAFT_23082 [Sphaerobolus stellatus SS14]|nr:hypothetical protein M422DRAFT_23082 [Sphaerobolus stellatus SS14]
MNYLRGALSAASQYYKDLPPINPSTLTGAIDVIVIERPAEDGGTELACSPFHVRFGKWQVLRPADKKVNVLVNGQPIPFGMKIGEAGEAFFVFETDEDVPEDLVTSPLLKATETGDATQPRDPRTGRFGAKEDQETATESRQPSPVDGISQEPEFLDLDAPDGRTTSPDSTDASNQSDVVDAKITINGESHGTASDEEPLKRESVSKRDASLASKAGRLGLSAVKAAAMEPDRFGTLKATAMSVRNSAVPIVPGLLRSTMHGGMKESDPGDEVLPPVDESVGQAPDVTYHHDVVLDLAGYHSKETSQRTVTHPEGWAKDDSSPIATSSDLASPGPSRTPSPLSSPESHALNLPRATSEPPEYGISSSPPPEYSWEWGSFPQRSPSQENFPQIPQFSNGPSSSETKFISSRRHAASPPPRSRSPIPEADTGKLEPDPEDEYRIWLDFEGQRLEFELSLCGESVRDADPFEVAHGFEQKRISYNKLMDDPQVVQSMNLVVRWDDEYIYRSDESPLIPALANWRHRTVSSTTKPQSSTDHDSKSTISSSRSSTWYRWWNRSRTLSNVNVPLAASSDTVRSNRPSMEHAESAPVGTANAETSIVPFPSTPPTLPAAAPAAPGKKYAKTLRLTSDQLKVLGLKKGANSITFSLSASGQVACTARIFVWDATDYVVVSDIDGTITKSDALGHVFTMIGRDWTHLGVAKLYTDICRNGYKIMYLTSRAIGQADSTRDYLKGIKQNNYQLPEGPVIMSPDRLLTSLHREVIMRKPEVFKMACLRDIQRLFGKTSHNAFYAGFGNRITDALSYRSVNIPSGRIFTIDSSGEVKMELLELAGYKSSYIHMTDIVDQMFPPVNRKWAPEYTDFNYWRAPITEFELPESLTIPPSPALTARSDNSTQTTLSRLRHFSLGRSSRAQSPELNLKDGSSPNQKDTFPMGHIRSAKSLDRFSSFLPVGEGVAFVDTHNNDDDLYFVPNGMSAGQGRGQRQRPESMPGSLDLSGGMHDPRWAKDQEEEDEDEEDEDEDQDGEDGGEGEEGEDAEQAFDDDLLATGEMENVPFL